MKNLYKIEDELYIISNNEAINENDHIITQDGRLVEVSYLLSKDVQGGHKVILTTNKLLIKNGVQAIDDEFLEWFVKNPSCEFVDVIDDTFTVGEMSKLPLGTRNHKYKIIIPQEEPKQEKLEEKLDKIVSKNPSKFWKESDERFRLKGTLEEATEIILANNIDGLRDALKDDDLFYFYKGVIQCYGEDMAKWQQEQDKNKFSEEEVLDILREFYKVSSKKDFPLTNTIPLWFEQLKNK
jgi:hypothetical protein